MNFGRNKILMVALMLVAFVSKPHAFAINLCEKNQLNESIKIVDNMNSTCKLCCISIADNSVFKPVDEQEISDCNFQDCCAMGGCIFPLISVATELVYQVLSPPKKISPLTQSATCNLSFPHYRPPIFH